MCSASFSPTRLSLPARSIRCSLPRRARDSSASVITACERDERSLSRVQPTVRAAWPCASSACSSSRLRTCRGCARSTRRCAAATRVERLRARQVRDGWLAVRGLLSHPDSDCLRRLSSSSIGSSRAPSAGRAPSRSRNWSLYSSTYVRQTCHSVSCDASMMPYVLNRLDRHAVALQGSAVLSGSSSACGGPCAAVAWENVSRERDCSRERDAAGRW